MAADWANRPVNWVSVWDAARFANWLHNGQPTGAQGPGTTENGAYINVGDQATFARQPGARFFIPTDDEWYKAAYHDKTVGLAASYFDYPTGTNADPGQDITESTNPGNNANYIIGPNYAIGSPYFRTVVGEFELSDSPYGTFDQGGNVFEWNETLIADAGSFVRGGGLGAGSGNLIASWYGISPPPSAESGGFGFRVASTVIPEPSTLLLLLCFGSLAVLWRRRSLVYGAILAASVGIICAEHTSAAPLYDIVPLGLADLEHTRNDGYRFSAGYQLNDTGRVLGTSLRYSDGAQAGQSIWLYDGTTTIHVGLTGNEYTRNDGYKYSEAQQLNDAGQVYGFSRRYNGGNADLVRRAEGGRGGGSLNHAPYTPVACDGLIKLARVLTGRIT